MQPGRLVGAAARTAAADEHIPADQHPAGNRVQVPVEHTGNVRPMAGSVALDGRRRRSLQVGRQFANRSAVIVVIGVAGESDIVRMNKMGSNVANRGKES